MNKTLLEKLYTTHAPSKQESKLSHLVGNELSDLGIQFNVDHDHQIYHH